MIYLEAREKFPATYGNAFGVFAGAEIKIHERNFINPRAA